MTWMPGSGGPTGVTMSRPADPEPPIPGVSVVPPVPVVSGPSSRLGRFTQGERWIHRSVGVLMGVCLITAAILSTPVFSELVGRRFIVSRIHIYCGLMLPVPILLGFVFSPAFRADVRRLDRFTPRDWKWLRAKDRRTGRIPVGKFNAGQKLNASFIVGAILVMLATGFIMWRNQMWPLAWRTGATFVHDYLALAILLVVIGHMVMASKDPEARTGMREGDVERSWAEREHGAWAAQLEAEQVAAVQRLVSEGNATPDD
jgi:formate dehydrogenase subunit gamma